MDYATKLFVWGFVTHIIADWIFQNEWMAENKVAIEGKSFVSAFAHPASWVHGGIHMVATLVAGFPPVAAVTLTTIHMIVDTRRPLAWWRKVYGQTQTGAIMVPLAFWQDQAVHIGCLAVAAQIVAALS